MTTSDIAERLENWHLRLSKAKDKAMGLGRRLEAEKGRIGRLEAKIKRYSVYKSYYEREGLE